MTSPVDPDEWLEGLGRHRAEQRPSTGAEMAVTRGASSPADPVARLVGHLKQEVEQLQRQVDTLSAEVRARDTALRLSTAETRLKTAESALAQLDGLPQRLAADLATRFAANEQSALEREQSARTADTARMEAEFAEQRLQLATVIDEFRVQSAALQARVDAHEQLVRRTAERMERLEPRLDWLERTGRIQAGAYEVDLDHPDDDVLTLREAIRSESRTEAALLTDADRESDTAEVRRHQESWEAARDRVTAAREAAGRLATVTGGADTPRPTGAYRRALRRFAAAQTALEKAAAEEHRLRGPAREAQQRLARDAAARSESRSRHAAADSARERLAALARERIERACGAGAVPPLWFWETFFPGPRSRPSGSWERLAAEVLTHRLVWGVRDPSPLGPEPDGSDRARLAEHRELAGRLAALDTETAQEADPRQDPGPQQEADGETPDGETTGGKAADGNATEGNATDGRPEVTEV